MWSSFSRAKASEVTMCSGYPFTAQTSARETPVLPPVYSTTETARREPSVRFRRLDHGQRHAVLHAAGRILTFQL